MNIGVPYHVDRSGRTAQADRAAYVRSLIELTLFTEPGERVDRPDFGCGLQRLVFSNDGNHAAAVRAQVRGALQSALHGVIEVRDVELTFVDTTISVEVRYVDPATGHAAVANLRRQM